VSEEILINVTPQETRVAVVENGVLQEVHIERARARGIVGNIYKGKVTRILPGMQAAFVDIGMERAAFLHASDILGRIHVAGDANPAGNRSSADPGGPPPGISELLHDGQEVVVQVVKDPLGTKGARAIWCICLTASTLAFHRRSRMTPNANGCAPSSRRQSMTTNRVATFCARSQVR
jgi:ribonuclease G